MQVTLFQAAESVREALATVDPDTGEISEAYSTSRELFERKGAACVAYAAEESAAIEAAETMLKTMQNRLNARKARLDRFQAYMADCMKASGITKLSCDGLVTATLYADRDESVELDPDAVWPAELCNPPKPPTPSKTLIKKAILAGEAVPARIVRKDRLVIK